MSSDTSDAASPSRIAEEYLSGAETDTRGADQRLSNKPTLKKIIWKPSKSPEVQRSESPKPKKQSGPRRKRQRKIPKVAENETESSSREHSVSEVTNAATIDNTDIIESSVTIPLTDPITKARMLNPVRSTKCTHIDAFDLDSFFKLHNISKIKLKSRRIKTGLDALRNPSLSLADRLNCYASKAPPAGKHEYVNKETYVMLKLQNKFLGRDNNNLRYFTCPICDKEFDIFNDLYAVLFLQEIIVQLNSISFDKNLPREFVDFLTSRKHSYQEVTHVVINQSGTYSFHVDDKYMEDLAKHELVELPDDDDDDTYVAAKPTIIPKRAPIQDRNVQRKKKNITIELSDSEEWADSYSTEEVLISDSGWDEANPILIDD